MQHLKQSPAKKASYGGRDFHVQGIAQTIWLVAPRLGAIVSAAAQDLNRGRPHAPCCWAECPNNAARGRRTDSTPGASIAINDFIVLASFNLGAQAQTCAQQKILRPVIGATKENGGGKHSAGAESRLRHFTASVWQPGFRVLLAQVSTLDDTHGAAGPPISKGCQQFMLVSGGWRSRLGWGSEMGHMVQKLSEQAKAYSERALDARRKADETANPTLRADFLEMERAWLLLARSCKDTGCLTDRTAANSDWQREFDGRVLAGRRADDKPRLQKLIHERNVDILFERMWLASIVESSDDAIISKSLDGIITSWNRSAEHLFGYMADEVIGRPVTIIIPPERHHEEDMILGHIRRGERVEHYETVRRRKDGRLVDISLTVSPVRGAEGRVVGASKIARDITAQKHAAKLLRRQADLLDQSHDAILSWKIGGGITYWSRGAEELYGYTSEEAIGHISHELLQTRAHIAMQDVEAQIAQQGSWYGELTHIARDGREIVVESRLVRVNYDGDLYTLETNRDITARKHAEEQVDLLMREANHRAKNMLGLVQAIARQTAAGDVQDFVGRFTERIQALAANQDLLVRHKWQGIDLKDLVRVQLAHFADLIGPRITLAGPSLRLNAAASQAIGLALHELATNAGKYGALSTEAGRVDIGWRLDDDIFTMSWIECNGPPVHPPERSGFGSTVTGPMVERTLGGEVQLDYAPSGLRWRLTCHAAEALEERGW